MSELRKMEELEELRHYFSPRAEVVTALPEATSVNEGTLVLLKGESEDEFHVMLDGKWRALGAADGICEVISFTSVGAESTEKINTVTVVNGIITAWKQT